MTSISFESRLLLLLGIIFGGWALIVVPPIVTFDAPGHYYRSLQVARGEFRAMPLAENNLGGSFAAKDAFFVDNLWTWYWYQQDFGTLSRWSRLSRECLQQEGERVADFTNIAIESPVNHIIQSAGFGFASLLSLGPLGASRLGSLLNLAAYLAMVIATIEILPAFRRGFLLFAASPLIFFQAASLSHDPINVSLPALFLAVAWRLRATAVPATNRALVGIVVLGSLVTLLKPIAICYLACFLFVPTPVFRSLRRRAVTLLSLFGCAGILWLVWNLPYLHLDIAAVIDPSRSASATALHKQWVMEHPLAFVPVFIRFLRYDIWEQWPVFFGGVGGWISSGIHRTLAQLSVVFLVGLLGTEYARTKPDWIWAGGLVAQSFLLLFGTCFVFWFAMGTVGLAVVPALGGRYLLLVYLAFFAGVLRFAPSGAERIRTSFFAIAMAANVAGILTILIATTARVAG